eukprot:500735-Prymnesium_polylepis.1
MACSRIGAWTTPQRGCTAYGPGTGVRVALPVAAAGGAADGRQPAAGGGSVRAQVQGGGRAGGTRGRAGRSVRGA